MNTVRADTAVLAAGTARGRNEYAGRQMPRAPPTAPRLNCVQKLWARRSWGCRCATSSLPPTKAADLALQ